MIPVKKLSGLDAQELNALFNRFGEDFSSVIVNTVVPIVNDVRSRGDAAVLDFTHKFDRVSQTAVMASQNEIEAGYKKTPQHVLDAFGEAKKNIEEFHLHQKRENFIYTRDSITLGMVYHPIDSVAVYAPGGKASYPSSILMGIIPAQIAGCENIMLITPPSKDGGLTDTIAAVCTMCGITNVVKAGGAQGIAAAGLGTQTVPKADLIVGPGNIYVTAAKTYLYSLGAIQIDSMAGPSEVLIISDGKTDAKWVAYDFLSQAEHEEMAIAVLVTTSEDHAKAVLAEIEKDIASGCGRHEIKKSSLARSGLILLVDSIDEAIAFSNKYGPEHMEFIVENPLEYLGRIKNVGSLFLGPHAPVAIGDYFSGTNHILPTGGAARFSSGTSVNTYMRSMTFQLPSREALRHAQKPVGIMSALEGFSDKHGGSIDVRFEKDAKR